MTHVRAISRPTAAVDRCPYVISLLTLGDPIQLSLPLQLIWFIKLNICLPSAPTAASVL